MRPILFSALLLSLTVSAQQLPQPDAPDAITAVSDSGGVSLTWTPGTDIQTYRVYRAVGEASHTELVADLSDPSYVDASIVAGVTYSYFAIACNQFGACSPPSPQQTLVPGTGGGNTCSTESTVPTELTLSVLDDVATLGWVLPASALKTNVYINDAYETTVESGTSFIVPSHAVDNDYYVTAIFGDGSISSKSAIVNEANAPINCALVQADLAQLELDYDFLSDEYNLLLDENALIEQTLSETQTAWAETTVELEAAEALVLSLTDNVANLLIERDNALADLATLQADYDALVANSDQALADALADLAALQLLFDTQALENGMLVIDLADMTAERDALLAANGVLEAELALKTADLLLCEADLVSADATIATLTTERDNALTDLAACLAQLP